MNRYSISGSEGEHQPNSNAQVLQNLLGITDLAEMNKVEARLLKELYFYVFDHFPAELTSQLLCKWHYIWLGNVYDWAGQYRTVDMSKPNIRFASPMQIPRLITDFEQVYLTRFNLLPSLSRAQQISYLAKAHVEFILLHPFREGNGRVARLMLDVMAVKAGAQPLDYSLWDQYKEFYFRAIQAGLAEDYQHIERLIFDVIEF